MKKLLGEMLIEDNIITREQLQEALNLQKSEDNLLGVILVKLGFLDDEILLEYLRMQGTKIKIKERKEKALFI
ncbi:MAG: hypothetical protein SVR08_11170 [Spirochaetota bacterium]|nr:hypothetical protein [Spirochaetota bacterium]